MFTAAILGLFQLSPGCQSTAMLTIDSCANVWAPWMAVRVYKTHFSLCGNDRMQRVKTTKLSQTAVCTDNYRIYLLTTIRQSHFMKSIIRRWRMSPPSDRTDNSDNTPRTYTDKLLSISDGRESVQADGSLRLFFKGRGPGTEPGRHKQTTKDSPRNGDLWR